MSVVLFVSTKSIPLPFPYDHQVNNNLLALKRAVWMNEAADVVYLELVYLVTALVPSLTACFASSPGSSRRTAVWISLEVMVDRLL